jgi:hypothetical protein
MSSLESLEHGEIEPCEVITQSTDITATTDITASTDVSEIDLSGYN